MGGGRQACVEKDDVVSGGRQGAPRLVGDVEGGKGGCIGQRERVGVVVDTVGEGARTGVGGLRTGVCRGDAGVKDAGLAFGVGVDAGEGGRGSGCRGRGEACSELERVAEWTKHGGGIVAAARS
jgi:hypothetical protein